MQHPVGALLVSGRRRPVRHGQPIPAGGEREKGTRNRGAQEGAARHQAGRRAKAQRGSRGKGDRRPVEADQEIEEFHTHTPMHNAHNLRTRHAR